MNKRFWTFLGTLLALLIALAATVQPQLGGDWSEYSLMAIAIGRHGGPDIRLDDVRAAQRAMPFGTAEFERIGSSLDSPVPALWFFRAKNKDVFASHFFAYSGLAALPFAALERAGRSPMRAFLLVNSLFVFVLGIALYRLFGSPQRTALALLIFMLAGGIGYWQWTSTECMTAAAFLGALVFFRTGAPIAAGVLAGIASLQNPPVIAFVVLAPLFTIATDDDPRLSLAERARLALKPRNLAGLAIVVAFAAIPVLFNLWAWGVPSIIAKTATRPALVTASRLFSYYFDLNQGLLVGAPGIVIALAVLSARAAIASRTERRRMLLVLGTGAAGCLALAIPALSTVNWNSASAGMMRYAFWGSMPLLFVLFQWLARMTRWPSGLLLSVLAVQAGATYAAAGYGFLEFGPLARAALAFRPQWYNPEPELFAERAAHQEKLLDPGRAYIYVAGNRPMKAMAQAGYRGLATDLCGRDGEIATFASRTAAGEGWEYLNGPFTCAHRSVHDEPLAIGPGEFNGARMRLDSGWSGVEDDHAGWHGVWSDAASSVLTVLLPTARDVHRVTFSGEYYGGNQETGVRINGVDLGRHRLAPNGTIALPPQAGRAVSSLRIELVHQAPRDPAADPSNSDPRHLAFFLRQLQVD